MHLGICAFRNHTECMIRRTVRQSALVLGIISAGYATSGCKLLTPTTVRTILNAAEWTCILLEQSVDSDAVMQACGIADDLKPAVEQAVAGKAAATRAGYRAR